MQLHVPSAAVPFTRVKVHPLPTPLVPAGPVKFTTTVCTPDPASVTVAVTSTEAELVLTLMLRGEITRPVRVGGATSWTDDATVIVADPLCPSLLAVMLAVPALTAVTSPVPLTVATAALLDDQVMTRPVSTLPSAAVRIAEACVV